MTIGVFDHLAELLERITLEYPEAAHAYTRMIDALRASNVGAGAPGPGDTFPDFVLPSAEGKLVSSLSLCAGQPCVFIFFRGTWCDFCSAHIAHLSAAADYFKSAGVRVALISGEIGGAGRRLKTAEKLPFEVLTDVDHGVAMTLGLTFRVDAHVEKLMESWGLVLNEIYGNPSSFLNIPATFVVGGDGVIVASHVDPDFRKRLSVQAILAALEKAQ